MAMTDSYNALTVVLERDIRWDDAETLILAIRQLRGVLAVHPNVSGGGDIDGMVAEQRVRAELRQKLWDALA
jgi:hypothetical protein